MGIRYRVGIMPGPWPPGRESGQFLFDLADFCEKSDIDSIWLSDRLSSPVPVPEVMTSLAAIAARTQKLKFGPSVLVLPYRTPVVAAKEMATIDWLSRGRLFPAVGVGVELPREFDASGVPFKERGRRTDEAIRVMRLLWTEDEVSYQGEFFKLDRVTVFPKPWQTPPPIWIGGKSEAAQKRTARLGDGWIPSFITPEEFRIGVHKVQELAAAEIISAPSSTTRWPPPRRKHSPWPSPTFRAAGWTRRPCAPAPPSAPSRCSRRGSRNTPRAAARSSSCARSALPSACSSSSPSPPSR
jgi:probable F420-dependent oxidoreductase